MKAENRILMIQNAEHVEAMRRYAIAKLYQEFDASYTEREMEVICKQARDCGLYEVADDIRQQWIEGVEDYKLQCVEHRQREIGIFAETMERLRKFGRFGMIFKPAKP